MANSNQSLFERGKNAVTQTLVWVKDSVQKQWEKYQLTNYTIAITTATSTLKLTISILPIIVEAMTTVAILQLLQHILPSILFTPWFYIPVMVMVSGFTGYTKYHELIERAKLDHQIIESEKKITQGQELNEKLNQTVSQLQKTLGQTQKTLTTLTKQFDMKKEASKKEQTPPPLRRSERLRVR